MTLYYGGVCVIGKCINQGINGYCEYTQRQKEEKEKERQRLQQIRELQEKKRMIREAIQKKRKVEEAMNNLPIHEQENIKEVLKKIEDDGKSINIDEITRQNIARHKKTTSKAKIIKYEFINDE